MTRSRLIGLLISAVIVAALYLFLATPAGLVLSWHVARTYVPGELSVDMLEGRWLGPVRVRGLRFQQGEASLHIGDLALDWMPTALSQGEFLVSQLHVTNLQLALGPEVDDGSPAVVPSLGTLLPFRVKLEDVHITDVAVSRAGEPVLTVDLLHLAAVAEEDRVELKALELGTPQGRVTAVGDVGLNEQTGTGVSFHWESDMTPVPLKGTARLSGTWSRTGLDLRMMSPDALTARLDLVDPFTNLRWRLSAAAERLVPAHFVAEGSQHDFALRLQASGNKRQARLDAEVDLVGSDTGSMVPLAIKAALDNAGDGWVLQPSVVSLRDTATQITVSGQGMYGGPSRLTAQWSALRWPLADMSEWSSPGGQLAWSGTTDKYDFEGSATLAGAQLPEALLHVKGSGDPAHINLSSLQVETLEGVMAGTASLGLQPGMAWKAELQATGMNPGVLDPAWSGRVNARLAARGDSSGDQSNQHWHLQGLTGQLRGYPLSGQGRLSLQGDQLHIEDLVLRSGDAELTLQARVDEYWQGQWQVTVPDLAMLMPEGAGSLRGHGSLRGQRATPRIVATLDLENGYIPGLRLAALQANIDVDTAARGRWQATISGQQLQARELQLDTVDLTLSGRAEDHQARLQGNARDYAIAMALQGKLVDGTWQGDINSATWKAPHWGRWSLAEPATVKLSKPSQSLGKSCWVKKQASLCLSGAGGQAEGWHAVADLTRLPLGLLDPYLPAGSRVEGVVDGKVSASLSSGRALQSLDADLRLAPGRLVISGGEDFMYQGGRASIGLNGDRGMVKLDLKLVEEDRVQGEWQLSGLQGTPGIEGRLDIDVKQLGVLETFTRDMEGVAGHLRAALLVKGPLAEPGLYGSATLDDARVTLPRLGLNLENIQVGARTGEDGRIRVDARVQDAKGWLAVNGDLGFQDKAGWLLALAVTGEAFTVVDIPAAHARLTPGLKLTARPGEVRVAGKVHMPYGRFFLRDFSGAVSPSTDALRLDATTDQETGWDIYSDVQLSLGDDVRMKGFGLAGGVDGKIDIHDEPRQLTTAHGALSIRDGTYKAYGQDLKIETGRLLYTGNVIDDPGLDIRAVRKVADVTAGIRVGGVLSAPDISLYSQPVMAESDALSYLLLGRPLNQASGSEGATLMNAASAAGLGAGGLVAAQIGDRFGIDEVTVGGGETLEEAAVIVGKYLSPRLYVNYSVGLLQPINTLKVRYQLSRRWAVQTESGVESGADFLFTLEH